MNERWAIVITVINQEVPQKASSGTLFYIVASYCPVIY
jgi:hypothetical protein